MKKFRVVVCGGREFADAGLLEVSLDHLFSKRKREELVILSGGARGADTLGAAYATSRGIEVDVFMADWTKYGRAAGMRRNAEMIATADGLVAFWDGVSKGTKHAIEYATKKGLSVRVVRY